MLSGGYDGIIALHDTGKTQPKGSRIAYNCLFTINEFNNKDKHSCGVYDVKWLPQETNAFLSWSCDRYIKIWDTRCVQVNSEFHFSRPVYKIALPKLAIRSSLLAVGRGAPNYSVELIDLRCGEINCKFNGHSQLVSSLSWSKTNENIIASGSDDCKISIWDIRNGKDCLLSANSEETKADYNSRAHSGPITALEFTDDGLYLISLGEDNKLRLWCALTGNLVYEKEIFKVSLGMSITEECNPDLIFIPSGNTVDIINLRDGKYLNTLQNGQSGRINCTCLNNSTLELYSGGVDGNIHCWNDEKNCH